MDNVPFPRILRRFVLTSIPSVPFLEALLLMRADPAQQWSRDSLAQPPLRARAVAEACSRSCAAPAWPRPAGPPAALLLPVPREDQLRERIDRWPTCTRATWSKSPTSSILPSTARPSNSPTPSNGERIPKWRNHLFLCTLTSLACAWLLLASYRRTGYRLLFWSGWSFVAMTVNNLFLVLDKIVFPTSTCCRRG
jgi:hypothetical protein